MYGPSFTSFLIARPQARPQTAASRRENLSGDVMSISNEYLTIIDATSSCRTRDRVAL